MLSGKISSFLQSYYIPPIVFAVALFCYVTNNIVWGLFFFAVLVSVILLFSEDVKNIFCILLFVGCFIKDIYSEADWVMYGLALGYAVIFILGFLVHKINNDDDNFKLGKMFCPILFLQIAFLLAGSIGNFQLLPFIITLGFNVMVLSLYLIAVNYTENLGKYLEYIFFLGAIFLSIQLFYHNASLDGTVRDAFTWHSEWANSEGSNTSSAFITLGIASVFSIIKRKKYGFMLFPAIGVFFLAIITTHCRMMTAISALTIVVLTIVLFIKSKKKLLFMLFCLLILGLAVGLIFLSNETIDSFITKLFNKVGFSGRKEIWAWCFDKFNSHKLLGYGFVDKLGQFPNGQNKTVIVAHNSVVQIICSLGIVGSIFALYFLFSKYKLVFSKIKETVLFIPVAIIDIALSGITDQAPCMDIFMLLSTIIIVTSIDVDFRKSKKAEGTVKNEDM